MSGGLRAGAFLVCLALVAAGAFLALRAPSPATFEKVEGRLHDVIVVPVETPAGPDRQHQLSITGAACAGYDYLESWARGAGLPLITDLDAQEPVTVYTDPRACAGFNGGGQGEVRAIVWKGRLYATGAYLHPPSRANPNLPAAALLLLLGGAGAVLLVRHALARRRPTALE